MGDLTATVSRQGPPLWHVLVTSFVVLYAGRWDRTRRGVDPCRKTKAKTQSRIASARWRGLTEVFHPQVSTPSRVQWCKCHNCVCSMAWRDAELSLAQVPGEGEHKIMQYIRAHRDDGNTPTRHCRRRVVNLKRVDAVEGGRHPSLRRHVWKRCRFDNVGPLHSRALLYVTPRGYRLRREQSSA